MRTMSALAFGLGLAMATGCAAEPPPASAFGRLPAISEAAISPNGQHVALLGGPPDRRIISIATIDAPTLPRLDLGDVETLGLRWAGDNFVLATAAYWRKEGPKISVRLERHITINAKAEAVARFLNTGMNGWYYLSEQPILQITSDPEPRAVIMDLAGVGDGSRFGLWVVDPATGKGRLSERGDGETYRWDLDRSGQARVRLDNDRVGMWARAKGQTQWQPLAPIEADRPLTRFLGYTEPEDGAYLRKDDKIVIRRLKDGVDLPFADGASNAELIWDLERNTAVGVSRSSDRPTITWIDPEVGAAHAVLARAFKSQYVSLVNWSKDRNRFVARVVSPGTPATWYLYDRARKEVSLLGEEYPELRDAAMGTSSWITYKARDGLEIPAYFILPPGAPAQGAKAPLIVLPHGGPAIRDRFDFDFIAQFLATRGYAVLQPQFRGSAGFGETFQAAGDGQWASGMQTDLLDGIKVLADRGDIDPARVCIVGASFGGYAALAGVAFHPEAYRCAASIAGISDLGQLLLEEGRVYGRETLAAADLKEMLGGATREHLEATSPVRHVDAIKAPILLIHGEKDTVVQPAQSQRMADALKAQGKPYELILLQDENHYLVRSATRTQTLEALEVFLAKNLPVKP